ncbi:MAG: tRNA (N6-isopentenyl adenosine(37)-C2)-methylthiotransferase MiaB [Sedimentisphaerales bacterium]|nr:tRNA (N6-isopentenyl adenosine(37)-C2)-methylthiotransferase MiaB [Sedimentisphaerales bacterium]
MDSKKVHIKSFGCQMNKLDTALVSTSLEQAGFSITENVKDADVVLINTCSVREHAEQRVISHIGHLKHIKESKPDMIVGIIGCMAQRLGDKLLEHKTVNIVCGPAQIPQIAALITQAQEQKKNELAVTEHIRKAVEENENQALEDFESAYSNEDERNPAQAFVRIMRGCNNFCTYCIVPYVRGPEVSRPPETILEQIRKLADNGVKQVTLLGQTVNSYQYKKDSKVWSLADLLLAVNDINGIEWIKFVTNYPAEEYFEDIMHAMADSPKVCKYLHMPAQSGSDRILKAMNRKYTAAGYLELLDKARSIVPGIAIAGDFIVGFPDETEEDFQDTVKLVQKAQYRNAFIFKYSPRPGTTSEKRLEDTIPDEVKQRRNVELLSVQEKISEELSKEYSGKEVKILVEGLSKKPHLNSSEGGNNPQLIGRTETDYIVVFNGPVSLAGKYAWVKITKSSPLTLFGELI